MPTDTVLSEAEPHWTHEVDVAFRAIPDWCTAERVTGDRGTGIRITDPSSHGIVEAYPSKHNGEPGSTWLVTTWVIGDGSLELDMFTFAAAVMRAGGDSTATSINSPLRYGDPMKYPIAFDLSSAPGSSLISALLGKLHADAMHVRTAQFVEQYPGMQVTNAGGWGKQIMVEGTWEDYEWFFLREKTYAYLNVGYSGGYPLWASYLNDLPYLTSSTGPLNMFFELFPTMHATLFTAPYDFAFRRETQDGTESKVWWKKAFTSTQARELLEAETGHTFTLLQGDDPRIFPETLPAFLLAYVPYLD